MLAKIWDQHVIARLSDDTDLLHIDRHVLQDLGGSRGLLDLKSRGLAVHNPELTFATPDHAISTARGRAGTIKIGQELLAALRVETSASGIQMFDIDEPGQGIVHVIGPELGLSLPGCVIVCGDSHTCTHGGLGALAFGIGSRELTHVLATQALIQRRPKTMRVKFEGKLSLCVTAKDLIPALIRHVGAAGGTAYTVEYASSGIRAMPIAGTPVDWLFIGSCTNSRMSDLRAAAEVARGRRVAPGVRAWIVPGSETVKRDAVAEGLDRIFIDAGFEWREPGCSMCLAANGETVAPGQRSVSTSNRNFVGRQGPRARTHLASPASAAAAAIVGAIADVRTMER